MYVSSTDLTNFQIQLKARQINFFFDISKIEKNIFEEYGNFFKLIERERKIKLCLS